MEEITPSSIGAMAKQKKFVTIKGANAEQYLVSDLKIEDDIISGNLKPTSQNGHVDKKIFRVRKERNAKSYLHLYTDQRISEGLNTLAIADITRAETHRYEAISSTITTLAILAVAAVPLAYLYVYLVCGCPHVSTVNSDGSTEFHGSLFPGSIFKSLERKDYLVLDNLQPDDEELIKIKISNDLEEIQFIDQVELLSVKHDKSKIGLADNKELVAFNYGVSPYGAKSQIGNSVKERIASIDDSMYNFDHPANDKSLNSLELSFLKRDLNDDALLVINAEQTKLMEQTAEVFFNQFGTDFPKWVDQMNHADPSNYKKNAIKQGIALNAYIKIQNKWEYIGSFNNAGTAAKRDLAIPVDLTNTEEVIKIKLESAYGLWSIDHVTLTTDFRKGLVTNKLEILTATNQDDVDVRKQLVGVDEINVQQSKEGTYTMLEFKAESDKQVTYILSGTGYYNHLRSYDNKPNRKILKKMRNNKFSTHELAQTVQLYSDMHLASNN